MDEAYEYVCEFLDDSAYADLKIYHGREPTEEEMEDYRECLMDKWS